MANEDPDGIDGGRWKWQLAWGRWRKWEAVAAAMPEPEFGGPVEGPGEWEGLRQVRGKAPSLAMSVPQQREDLPQVRSDRACCKPLPQQEIRRR